MPVGLWAQTVSTVEAHPSVHARQPVSTGRRGTCSLVLYQRSFSCLRSASGSCQGPEAVLTTTQGRTTTAPWTRHPGVKDSKDGLITPSALIRTGVEPCKMTEILAGDVSVTTLCPNGPTATTRSTSPGRSTMSINKQIRRLRVSRTVIPAGWETSVTKRTRRRRTPYRQPWTTTCRQRMAPRRMRP